MRRLLLFIFFMLTCATLFSQDNYANALVSLDKELDFKITSNAYLKEIKPDEKFITRFKKCAEYEKLEKITDLDFEKITSVKDADLVTSKWKGRWQIRFQEWTFENENDATHFINILDSIAYRLIQFCVSKGGIMWWKDESKIYVVTSKAYFVTYHYKEIKNVIINGLSQ